MQQVYAKSASQLSKNGQNFVTMGALPIKKRVSFRTATALFAGGEESLSEEFSSQFAFRVSKHPTFTFPNLFPPSRAKLKHRTRQ
jgi:hypothetical protein